jgi:hypothetical protein
MFVPYSLEDQDGFVKAKVKPRDKLHLDFHIDSENVHLEWKFRTDGHDISFALCEDSTGEIIPLKRVESHKSLQEGRHKCETAGKYTIIFDNTYSYTRSKTLYHKIEVVVPADMVDIHIEETTTEIDISGSEKSQLKEDEVEPTIQQIPG